MSNDYIRREDAVSAVEFGITLASAINIETGEWTELFQRENDELREAVDRIKDIKPADVAPVVHAYWRDTGSGQECSACKEIQYGYDTGRHYCPNCGAKMDAQREE